MDIDKASPFSFFSCHEGEIIFSGSWTTGVPSLVALTSEQQGDGQSHFEMFVFVRSHSIPFKIGRIE